MWKLSNLNENTLGNTIRWWGRQWDLGTQVPYSHQTTMKTHDPWPISWQKICKKRVPWSLLCSLHNSKITNHNLILNTGKRNAYWHSSSLMKTYNLFLKLLLTRLHPSPYDYALVLHDAHSSTEWNICLIIKQTVNKSTPFTKKKSSTGPLHYKEFCEEQCWPGGFLSPPLESYSQWKEASSPWAQQEQTHRQACH